MSEEKYLYFKLNLIPRTSQMTDFILASQKAYLA